MHLFGVLDYEYFYIIKEYIFEQINFMHNIAGTRGQDQVFLTIFLNKIRFYCLLNQKKVWTVFK